MFSSSSEIDQMQMLTAGKYIYNFLSHFILYLAPYCYLLYISISCHDLNILYNALAMYTIIPIKRQTVNSKKSH